MTVEEDMLIRMKKNPKIELFDFKWPEPEPLKIFVKDILEENVDEKYYLGEKQVKFITDSIRLKKKYTQIDGEVAITQTARQYTSWNGQYIQWETGDKDNHSQQNRPYSVDGFAPTLGTNSPPKILVINTQPRMGKGIGGKGIISKDDGTSYCVDTGNSQANSLGMRIRRLTPKEINESFKKEPCIEVYRDYNETKKGYKVIREILSRMWKEIGEETLSEWGLGVFPTLSKEEILRPNLYEGELQGKMDGGCFASTGECESKTANTIVQMRVMWEDRRTRCSSQRREQIEQLFRELTSALQKLSHETASDKTEVQNMRKSYEGFGTLQQALLATQEGERQVRIRRLSPTECFRLQGFLNDQINLDGISDTQKYKLAGNGQSLNVVTLLFKAMGIERFKKGNYPTK